jgi:predicted MPP superfamily phosphohydrolase
MGEDKCPAREMDDQPPVDARNYIHHVLVGLHALSRLPRVLIALGLALLAGVAGGVWYALTHSLLAWLAAGGLLAASLADWAWLAALPRRHLSFGPPEPPLLGLSVIRLLVAIAPLAAWAFGMRAGSVAILATILQAALFAAVAYATRIEPFRLGVTYVHLSTDKLPQGCRVRLAHLSDLHVERVTRRERELIERVRALDADYVLLTGDYLNFSYVGEPRAIAEARQVLGALHARHGIYAVRGTHQVDPNAVMSALLEGLPIHWLRSEHVIRGQDGCRLALAGASCTRRRAIDVPALERALDNVPPDLFTVLLYHTPELVPEAAERQVDLYLAGHTHGGQFRLPWYGALVTATDVGKRYEMGRYDVGDLVLYVSRGIGMEGMAAPRARFLCPPEIVCIDVIGSGPAHP